MRLFVLWLLCLPALTLATESGRAQEKWKDTPYYPLKVGTRWVYRAGARTVVARVTKHEEVGGVPCACIEAGEGDESQVEYLAVREDGVYRYKVNGQELQPPLLVLKLPPKVGETWKVASKLGENVAKGTFTLGEQEVTVPAGKYKTVTVSDDDFQIAGERVGLTWWYAKGVGPVRQTIRVGGGEMLLELEKFQAGD